MLMLIELNIILWCLFDYENRLKGKMGVMPTRSRHCNAEPPIISTVDEQQWEGDWYAMKLSQETCHRILWISHGRWEGD